MNSHENITHPIDIAIGACAVTAHAWLPVLHGINDFAAFIASVGGAILVVVRLYFMAITWIAYRKKGKIPPLSEE